MILCEACRRKIGERTRRRMRELQRDGKHVGRPRLVIPEGALDDVEQGRVSATAAADALDTTPQTINRRLRERKQQGRNS